MKKSLIALAVAGTIAAPAAFAATANVDIYGIMNIAIQDTDANNVDLDVVDNVSRIGFKGSEDLGGGLKAIWQIEQGLNASTADQTAFGGKGLRNTFVGLSGGFGTALIGLAAGQSVVWKTRDGKERVLDIAEVEPPAPDAQS